MKFQSKKMTLTDGGMHHLGAKIDDVCDTMILTCAAEDVPEISKFLENAKETASHREYLTHKGSKNDKELAVMSIGHGCMPMSIAVEELNHLEVGTIVKIGDCQALVSGIEPGTILIPCAAVRSEGASREYVPNEYPAIADIPLMRKLMKAFEDDHIETMTGLIRSHDAFYAEQPSDPNGRERIDKWASLGVLANEHECSVMFVLSQIFQMRSAAVLIVTENVADGTKLDDNEFSEIRDSVSKTIIDALSLS